ncbi:hypothetical protein REPUB_Repub06bG0001600 [Reevesia pubescens]
MSVPSLLVLRRDSPLGMLYFGFMFIVTITRINFADSDGISGQGGNCEVAHAFDKKPSVTGEVSYNGYGLEEFVPQKTSAYNSQTDLHIAEMTVRETRDFSARCRGVGSRAEIMMEVSRREKEAGIVPDPDTDTYMKILGLDICADTFVGDGMRRGISGGEMIVGPTKALFMDAITNGLDSSTAFQIVTCLQQLAHITDASLLVSLLQPAPETFDLFDDIILMAEGRIVYHGCPERKGIADFIQEVMSKKDQAQYWHSTELPYSYFSVDMFSKKFKESALGKKLDKDLSMPYDRSPSHKSALSFSQYSLSKWELFRACMSRELLFKTSQLIIVAVITMTVFLRTRMHIDVLHGNYYMGALFFSLVILLVDGIPELSMTVARLEVFYRQKELRFYPAWAYEIPAGILKIPLSLLESLVWTCLTYYVIGYSPEAWRFFHHFILLFAVHLASLSMFRFLASVFQTAVASMTVGSFGILFLFLFGGFIITQPSMPVWLRWGFWVSPLTYGEIGLSVNEFLAPRWQRISSNTTIGQRLLESRGLNFEGYLFWISLGALFGFTIVFNIGFTLALSFLKSPGSSREKLSQIQGREDSCNDALQKEKSRDSPANNKESSKGKMVLPFQPLTVAFQDLQYYVDTPLEMRERGFAQKKFQLLSDITGVFRPGVLTALMGVSGAGKTTLLDVLAGRKTTGYIEGEIKIGGYPKVQETFARISGYYEQSDIHSPQITVEESVVFSTWLCLAPQIDSKTKAEFVNQVLQTIELDGIKGALVGIPGVSGLSTEQRKRLTIAVELVANPLVIFMDEPSTGLDARAAAIVMRAVKNVADTGRTIVCTIHQPSIDIFEAFAELILLKPGGRIIYSGPLREHSSGIIDYFEGISVVPKIRKNYNPATWMLEVTSTSAEADNGVDFAQIYKDSALYERNREIVRQFSTPPPGSRDLHFPTRFSRNAWGQFKSCLWKQNLSYWRSPSYNLTRIIHTLVASLLFAVLETRKKMTVYTYFLSKNEFSCCTKYCNCYALTSATLPICVFLNVRDNQQNLFNILGSMYTAAIFLGIGNCSTVLPYVATERTVMYRERFAGMYSAWTYALAQVTVEIPYLFIQSVIFVIITYPMIGYYGSAYKVFCKFQDGGFGLYYLTPTSWTMNGMLTYQYGDIHKEIMVFGETKTVASFLKDYFGFHHDRLAISALVLIAFPLAFASIFAFCVGRLNFQRR